MMRKKGILLLMCVLAFGCGSTNGSGSSMVPNHVIEIQEATSADIYLRMVAGNVILGAKAKALLVGTYHYNSPVRVPVVTYKEIDRKGWLKLTQEETPTIGSFARNDAMNQWDVQLNKDVPLEMTVEYGRGKGVFDLSELNLKRIKFLNKNGKLSVDLSARALKEDLVVWINNDAGDIDITLPKDVGVRLTTVRGANITVEGLKKDNAIYKNDLEGSAVPHVFLDIKSDGGNIVVR